MAGAGPEAPLLAKDDAWHSGQKAFYYSDDKKKWFDCVVNGSDPDGAVRVTVGVAERTVPKNKLESHLKCAMLIGDAASEGHKAEEIYEEIVLSRLREDHEKTLLMIEKKQGGYKSFNLPFFCGVINMILVAWFFGALPQHFWALYILEVCVLFPMRFSAQWNAKNYNESLFWLDFCWVANFLGVFVLAFLCINDYYYTGRYEWWRKLAYTTGFGIGCGPLLLAVGFLGNKLVFHDPNELASVLIHLFPSLVFYTLTWCRDRVESSWPEENIFTLDYINSVDPWRDVWRHAVCGYAMWWVAYVAFIMTCGLTLPHKTPRGYDTIAHYSLRGGTFGNLVRTFPFFGKPRFTEEQWNNKVKTNDFSRCDVLIYMVLHAFATILGISVSPFCFMYKPVHALLTAAMVIKSVFQGAQRYQYYISKMYGELLRAEFGLKDKPDDNMRATWP